VAGWGEGGDVQRCKGLRDVTEKCGTNVWQSGGRREMCKGLD